MNNPIPLRHAGGLEHLVQLDQDHPGFRDPVYRARRDRIARIALEHETGSPVPDAPYTEEEHLVWRTVWEGLRPLHDALVCREILELQKLLPLEDAEIPQLAALNPRLEAASGYRMEPVAGLVDARTFLEYLGHRVFLSTQYIRHHTRPFYTPEPDVVHELVGHAATLAHPGIARVNTLFGEATELADETQMQRLANVYWYTVEFGLVAEDDGAKAFGAGLLSSVGELSGFREGPELRGWDLATIAETSFDPTAFQPQLFVAPAFDQMLADLEAWVGGEHWR